MVEICGEKYKEKLWELMKTTLKDAVLKYQTDLESDEENVAEPKPYTLQMSWEVLDY